MASFPSAVIRPGPATYPGAGIYDPAVPQITLSTSGLPRAEIVIRDLAAGTATVTLYRLNGRRTARVRAAINVYAVGGFAVTDSEIPPGLPVTYRAEMFDADGYSLGFTRDVPALHPAVGTWAHNVLDVSTWMQIELARGAAGEIDRPTNADVVKTEGSSIGVYGGGYRSGVTGVELPFYTLTDADADRAVYLFGDPDDDYPLPAVVCFRSTLPLMLPRPFYGACTVTATPINLHAGGHTVRWNVTATEVRPPAQALQLGGYTLGNLDDAYPTLGDIDDAYLTLLDVDRDFALTGYEDPNPDPPTEDPTPNPDADPPEYGAGAYGTGTYGA